MKISVALCTYNGAKYIEQQLKSILRQTVQPDEIVISDDGSSDDTLQRVEACLAGQKIECRILHNQGTHGVVGNFTNAILACSGELIFTSDQDDVWRKDKVEIMTACFEKDEKVMLAFSDAELVDGELHSLHRKLWDSLPYKGEPEDIFQRMLKGCIVTGAAMAFRKSLFEENAPVGEGWLHDGWLGICAAAEHAVVPIHESLILYRQHGMNSVGARDMALRERVRAFVRDLSSLEEIRENRYRRYHSARLALEKKLTEEDYRDLRECERFWEENLHLKKRFCFGGICRIVKNLCLRRYVKYYSGTLGAVRDLVSLFTKEEKNRSEQGK